MTDKYITSVQDILVGFECNRRIDENPYDGDRFGALRYYKGVKSYDIVSHDDEDALLFVVTDYRIILVVATASKLTDLCSACAAVDARYYYENRNGKIIFRCDDKRILIRRLLTIDWKSEYEDGKYCDDDSKGEPEGEPEEDAAEAAHQAALSWAQADIEAQRATKVEAKSNAIAAALKRADAEEAAANTATVNAPATSMEKAVATVTERGPALAKQNPGKADWRVDAGDLSDFE